MRAVAGEVWNFHSRKARKRKFHLCIGERTTFLFVNSNRLRNGKPYPGDFVLDKKQIPFLTPTEYGKSFVSCSWMLNASAVELATGERRARGSLSPGVMRELVAFIEGLETLSDVKRERLLEHLYDVYAEAA